MARILSLSHVVDPATISLFPGDPRCELTTIATIDDDGYFLQYIALGEHTGTHWGAPCHFNAGEPSADQLDPDDLFLPAVKVDIRDRTDPDYAVTIADLVEWEAANGPMPQECAVLLWTGWESLWGTSAFANLDDAGVIHHPGFAPATVAWLIDRGTLGHRGALGTDAFSPDVGCDTTYSASKMLYRRHRISLEILTNLAAVPTRDFHVLAGGTIYRNGSGSPATIYAFLT